MDLAQTTETIGAPDDRRWWGSAHATQNFESVTLDAAAFNATWGPASASAGWVPSGVAIAKRTSDGLWVPYNDGGAAGVNTMVGHLATSVKIRATGNVGAALFHHGTVIESLLPTTHGLDAAGKVDVAGRIRYR